MSDPETIELTPGEIRAAIRKVLRTGEHFKLGDTERRLSLEELRTLLNEAEANDSANAADVPAARRQFSLVAFGAPTNAQT